MRTVGCVPLLQLLRRHGDAVLAATVALVMQLELMQARTLAGWVVTVPLGLLATAPLAYRRRLPLASFVVLWCALFGLHGVAPGFDATSGAFFVTFFVSFYSLGAYASGRQVWAAGALVLVGIVRQVLNDGDPSVPGDWLFSALLFGGPWGAGLTMRLRRQRERVLTVRTQELEQGQEELAHQAVAAERARIARELHDVVSHAISVTILQSRGGRRMLGTDDVAAAQAFDAIEHVNQQALGDMRRLLALLRDSDEELSRSPQPSLARLDALAEQLRASGLPVDLEVSGDPRGVPPGVDSSGYRIVQEALTNVLRHAEHARALVQVRFRENDLEICVTNDGAARHLHPGNGHGLLGIRERVAVVGGEVEAGPRPEGGFRVQARLPYAIP